MIGSSKPDDLLHTLLCGINYQRSEAVIYIDPVESWNSE